MDINIADNLQGLQEEELHSRQGALHHYILSFMAMLGLLLEVKQAAGSKSPFVTDHLTMLTFIAVLSIYIWSLVTVRIMQPPIPDLAEFMNNISLLFGSLASILLLLILFGAFGWFTIFLWIIYFVRDIVTKESYMKTLGYVSDRVEKLFKAQENMEAAESVVQTQDVGEQNLDENIMEENNVAQIQDAGKQNVDNNDMEEQNVEEYRMEEPNGLP
ncbi:hypothetical protein ABKV19_010133 [Rosa sericea]